MKKKILTNFKFSIKSEIIWFESSESSLNQEQAFLEETEFTFGNTTYFYLSFWLDNAIQVVGPIEKINN